jgi:hypothetical protein
MYGCDKNINSQCSFYDIEDAYCYDYYLKEATCSCGTECLVDCWHTYIKVKFDSNETCAILTDTETSESRANSDGQSYLGDTITIYENKDTGDCSMDLDLDSLLYAGMVFIILAGLVFLGWIYFSCFSSKKESYEHRTSLL